MPRLKAGAAGIRQHWIGWSLAIILVLAATVRLIFLLTIQPTFEDALITLRYAENLASGQGFVYNVGEQVQGTTSPLFTLLLAALALLTPDALLVAKLVSIAADVFSCFLVFACLRLNGYVIAGLIAALILSLAPPNIYWSISGMETAIFTCLGVAAIFFYYKRSYTWLAIAAAALILTRPDGVILLVVLSIFILYSERRVLPGPLLLFLLIAIPWYVFAAWYFGSPVPQSIPAKQSIYNIGFLDNLDEVVSSWTYGISGKATFLMSLFGTLLAVLYVRWALPLVVFVVAYYLAFLASGTLLFQWYLIPPSPAYYMIVSVAVSVMFQWIAARREFAIPFAHIVTRYTLLRHVLFLLAVVIFLGVTVSTLQERHAIRMEEQEFEDTVRKDIGLWLRNNSPSGASIGLEPIGYIGYYSDRHILDFAGLVSPQVLQIREDSREYPLAGIIFDLNPDLVVLRDSEYEQNISRLAAHEERFSSLYVPVYQRGIFTVYQLGDG